MGSLAEGEIGDLSDERGFGDLSPETLEALRAIQSKTYHPQGSIIFAKGQSPSGIFLVTSGKAKLSTSDRRGKTRLLRIAGPGEILGLSATVSGKPHDATAETILPTHVVFIGRNEFLRFLLDYPEAAFRVVELLSDYVEAAYQQLRSVLQSRAEKTTSGPGPASEASP